MCHKQHNIIFLAENLFLHFVFEGIFSFVLMDIYITLLGFGLWASLGMLLFSFPVFIFFCLLSTQATLYHRTYFPCMFAFPYYQ
jgi:hypothetical protein